MRALIVAGLSMLAVAFAASNGPLTTARNYDGGDIHTGSPVQFVPGRILVKFRSNIGLDHSRQIIAALGARDSEEVPDIGVHILALPDQADEKVFVEAFQARPEVEFAELDRIVTPADITPNDPFYLNGDWSLRKISAPTAWSTTTGAARITIAIIDTGVDGAHPDLASKMVPGWNVYDNNSDTSDVFGHGTIVAGTAAAASNNGIGVASVAWDCRIMPVRVSAVDGTATYSSIASGLNWAGNNGARVANISYMASNSSTVTRAANRFRNQGGVVTVSAGNYAAFDPASDNPSVLTISATDENDLLYSWSNRGNIVDLAAPGQSYTTYRGGGYGAAAGTSISAPVVAGLAALVFSANPALSADEVENILKNSADDLSSAGWDPGYGWGRVNAARAVAMAGGGSGGNDSTAPVVSITSPTNGSAVSGMVSIVVSASDNVGVVKIESYVDGVLNATSTSAPFTTKWNSRKAASGTHTLQCKAYDAAGNTSLSQIVNVAK